MKSLNNTTAVNLLFDKVKGFILSRPSKNSRRRIGVEIESFVYNKDLERIPIYDNNSTSASELLDQLNYYFFDYQYLSILDFFCY